MMYKLVGQAADGTKVYVNSRGEYGTFEGGYGLSGGFFKKLGKFAKKGLSAITKVSSLVPGLPGANIIGGFNSAINSGGGGGGGGEPRPKKSKKRKGKNRNAVAAGRTRRVRVRSSSTSAYGGSPLIRAIAARGRTRSQTARGGVASSLTISDVAQKGRDILDVILNPSGGGDGAVATDNGGGGGGGAVARAGISPIVIAGAVGLGVLLLSRRR